MNLQLTNLITNHLVSRNLGPNSCVDTLHSALRVRVINISDKDFSIAHV